MSTLNWPPGRAFGVRRCSFGVSTPRSAFSGFFSGQTQSISHLADRLRCTLVLPPCAPAEAQAREAFFMEMASAGHWVRLGHMARNPQAPAGSLRGSPTVAVAAASGARSLQVQSSSALAGQTLLGGDLLGLAGRLLITGYAGASTDGAGLLTLPLALPLQDAVAAGAALQWSAPTSTFQLPAAEVDFLYGRGAWQAELELNFQEAF